MEKSLLVSLFLLFAASNSFAQTCDGQDCYESIRVDGETKTFATEEAAYNAWEILKARADVNQDGSFQMELAALSATAGTLGAAAVAGYFTYSQKVEAAQKAAGVVREQAKVLKVAIERALGPELQRFATALMHKNSQLAASGAAQLTEAQAANYIKTGLQSPAVKERIIQKLTNFISGTAGRSQARQLAEHVFHNTIRDGIPALQRQWTGALRSIATNLASSAQIGRTLAGGISSAVTPRAAQFTGRRILAEIAKTGAKGFLATCKLFGKNLLSTRALAFLGGGWATGAMILLDASPLGDGTLRSWYTNHPDQLLMQNDAEAMRMLRYPSVRNSVMALYHIVQETDDAWTPSYENQMCDLPAGYVEMNEHTGVCNG